ncbi:TIM barrel protein [Bradyrhizobium sp. NAS80.1]|uniref:sugar phosphate isomerase/epimerase family protein n=1 Tax=Bradyrhizobium sp. NAS80.1 TaxID=1680159 RepID=UPI000A6C6404|nr:TIM barrel protein [Bradyrhizobium sp. NAS80.1]
MANFSLAALTVLELPPPEMIELAARCGYEQVGLRLSPATPGGVAYRLMDDALLLRETLQRLQSTGVTVADLEVVAFRPETDVASFTPFFETGARLGAKYILVAAYDPDLVRFSDRYRQFCEAAAKYGLTSDLEFMPWTSVPDLKTAMRIVAEIDHPAAGILVDALHFDRSQSSLADLRRRSGFTTGSSATARPSVRPRRSSSSMPRERSGCFPARAA